MFFRFSRPGRPLGVPDRAGGGGVIFVLFSAPGELIFLLSRRPRCDNFHRVFKGLFGRPRL